MPPFCELHHLYFTLVEDDWQCARCLAELRGSEFPARVAAPANAVPADPPKES